MYLNYLTLRFYIVLNKNCKFEFYFCYGQCHMFYSNAVFNELYDSKNYCIELYHELTSHSSIHSNEKVIAP